MSSQSPRPRATERIALRVPVRLGSVVLGTHQRPARSGRPDHGTCLTFCISYSRTLRLSTRPASQASTGYSSIFAP